MALLSTKGRIPKDAVPLSRQEAIGYQWKQIQTWPNKSDVWVYHWGISSLGAIAGAAGLFINHRFRRKLKLRDYGTVTTALPLIFGPAIFSTISHVQFVTQDIFLNKTKCPLCLQQKAVAIQIGIAIIYPTLLSPVVNFYMAASYATYRVPYWSDWRGTFNLWWTLTKPMGKSLLVVACLQAVAATYVTYTEAESLYKLRMKLLKKVPEETEIQTAENVTVTQ